MVATIVVSTASSLRLERARSWLARRAPAEEVLIIGSTLDAVGELVRNFTASKGAIFGWHRFTLTQLSAVIAEPALAKQGVVPLSRIATEAVVAKTIHGLKDERQLGRYAAVADTPGFPRGVAGVLAELRLAGLRSSNVDAFARDLRPVIDAYEKQLREMGATDWPGILAIAADIVGDAKSAHRLVGLPLLLHDVAIRNEQESNFVDALIRAAPDALVTVPSGDSATIARVRNSVPLIEDVDPARSQDDDDPTAEPPSTLRNLQRNLFVEQPISASGAARERSDGEVEVFSAPGEGRECVEIARRVLLLAKRGIPFDRIAILLRSPEVYRSNLEEAFNRAAIPIHFTKGAVRPDPAGRAFIALLKCAAEGLSARRFAEYLSLAQVPDLTAEGAPPPPIPNTDRWVAPDSSPLSLPSSTTADEAVSDRIAAPVAGASVNTGQLRAPRRWERLLVEAAVVGGRDRWRHRIEGLANDLRLRLAEISMDDQAAAGALSRMIDDLASLSSYAIPLIDALDALPAATNWGDWLDQLSALATRALRQPHRVLSMLAELAPLRPVGPIALREVLATLEPLLTEVTVPPVSSRYGKVLAGPIDVARGMVFEAVFVPGLAEKMFPRKIIEEPILLDAARQQIGGDLVTNQDRLDEERLALAIAVGAAERHICFSYPRLDLDQARPRIPSFYALEAIRAAEGELLDFAALARRAETATATRLGWPAPSDPADAIDDAEHDLAVLTDLVSQPEASDGRARYLIGANPHLARSLRTRYQRWGRSWTSSDGLVSQSDAIRRVMAAHTIGVRSYSPTALQNYARCPYRFFLQAIQGIAPRDTPEAIDELEPLQRGALVHDIQFELFSRLHAQSLLPVRPSNLAQARLHLEAVVDEVAARYFDDLAPAIERVWRDGIANVRADLREWLRRASTDESGYVPWHFELSFGLGDRANRRHSDPQSVPGAISLDCGLQLRGSIDLVERHPADGVRVTDHKTGKDTGTARQMIDGGKALQPLLYALAAEKLFHGQATVSSGRLYFCTSAGGFSEQVISLDQHARVIADEVAGTIGNAIEKLFLPAAPDKGECERCDFRAICGPYEERRTARKPQRNIEPLLALRGLS